MHNNAQTESHLHFYHRGAKIVSNFYTPCLKKLEPLLFFE